MTEPINYFALPGYKTHVVVQFDTSDTIHNVIAEICKMFSLPVSKIYGLRRDEPIAFCRQICMYILHKKYHIGCARVGRVFKRDHTTVLHASQKIKGLIQVDSSIAEMILKIETSLK